MLVLRVPLPEAFDDKTQEFVQEYFEVEMLHSLASLSKWESKWKKPFMVKEDKTTEQLVDYLKFMTLTPNVPDEIYEIIIRDEDCSREIEQHLVDKATATWFTEEVRKPGPEQTVTAELVYYQMFSLNIPLEFENRHLNHLLTLIRVFQNKNNPEETKRSKSELHAHHRSVNEARRAKAEAERRAKS